MCTLHSSAHSYRAISVCWTICWIIIKIDFREREWCAGWARLTFNEREGSALRRQFLSLSQQRCSVLIETQVRQESSSALCSLVWTPEEEKTNSHSDPLCWHCEESTVCFKWFYPCLQANVGVKRALNSVSIFLYDEGETAVKEKKYRLDSYLVINSNTVNNSVRSTCGFSVGPWNCPLVLFGRMQTFILLVNTVSHEDGQ